MKTEIDTTKGKIQAEIIKEDEQIQLNVFHTSKGVGFFLIYPIGQYQKMMKSAKAFIESDKVFEADMDITSEFDGCLLAGTAPKLKFDIAFGRPTISH